MKKVIEGKLYNTETATLICTLPCHKTNPRDFEWHDTELYRSPKGTYFVAGEGGAASMWARPVNNGNSGGEGLRVVDAEDARGYAEAAGLDPEEMVAAGFPVEAG